MTASQVYDGSWFEVAKRRQETLTAAYAADPHRHRRAPTVTVPAQVVTLNLGNDDQTQKPPILAELIAA